MTLAPVDKVEIQVLVDNVTDGLSTTPANVENEFAFATRRGLPRLVGPLPVLRGAWLIVSDHGSQRRQEAFGFVR